MVVVAGSSVPNSVVSALIAAVVAFAVAVFGQVAITSRERASRRYERRRAALLDVQDSALELRQHLREYGELVRAHPGQPNLATSNAEHRFDAARSRLAVALSRVEDQRSVAAVVAWREAASVSFISELDVSASQEQARWDELNGAIGRALQSKSGTGPD
ncbi:MAG: hypothetical protein ABI140_05140 [Jatrophihabitantaceae bacterium]